MVSVKDLMSLKLAREITSYTGTELLQSDYSYQFKCSSFLINTRTAYNKENKVCFSVHLKKTSKSFRTWQDITKNPVTLAKAVARLIETNRSLIIEEVKAIEFTKQYQRDLEDTKLTICRALQDTNSGLTKISIHKFHGYLPFKQFTGGIDALRDKAHIQMYIPKKHIAKVLKFIDKLDGSNA